MAILTKHPTIRWIAPVAAAVLAVGVPVTIAAQASAEPPLPPKTAQQLLVDLQGVQPRPLSGEVRQVANLGLPELPGFASPTVKDVSVGSLLTLASGTHSWRVWTDGASASRVALVQASGETDVIRNGTDVWVWSSAESSAVHSTLPTGTKGHDATGAQRTPQQVADEILTTLDPTTEVTTERADRVAGRAVYELVLTPRQTDTKVGRVRLAVDAETTVPLRVQVFASDGTDALDVAFTSVSFDAPDPGLFRFTAPAGTTVTEQSDAVAPAPADRPTSSSATPARPRVTGTGWSTVVVGESPVAATGAGTPGDRSVAALLDSLPTVSGAWGQGRLLDSALVSVVLTDDGRVAAGAVTPDTLYAALGAR